MNLVATQKIWKTTLTKSPLSIMRQNKRWVSTIFCCVLCNCCRLCLYKEVAGLFFIWITFYVAGVATMWPGWPWEDNTCSCGSQTLWLPCCGGINI
jgi:hypothetical protein